MRTALGLIVAVLFCVSFGCANNPPLGGATYVPNTDTGQDPVTDGTGMDGPDGQVPTMPEPPPADEVPVDAPRSFHCDYTNVLGGGLRGCKDYPEGMSEEEAVADCGGLVQAGDTGVVTAGACDLQGAHGYCSDPNGMRDVGYDGGCDPDTSGSGAWACDTFVTSGVWTCTLTEPVRSCLVDEAAVGTAGCIDFVTGTTLDAAEALCGGTVVEAPCDAAGVIAACTSAGGNRSLHYQGGCADLEGTCEGTFECLFQPPPPVYTCRFQGCVSTGLFGCSDGPVCVDYPGVDGWTYEDARAACDARNGDNTFIESLGQTCLDDVPAPDKRCRDDDGSLRYGIETCTGNAFGDFFGAPGPDPGPFPDYNAACDTTPNFQGILTCRYTANPVGDLMVPACVDFPQADGWDEQSAYDQCAGLTGTVVETIEMSNDSSCLQTDGASGSASRCATADGDGKRFFPYGVPEGPCADDLGGTPEKGPFCETY